MAQTECFAGLTDVAVPVVHGGRHMATLWSGKIFRRTPTQRDFERTVAPLRGELSPTSTREAQRAYFARPVVTPECWELAVSMLHVMATLLGERAGDACARESAFESPAVASAKRYVCEHQTQPIAPADVVDHVRMNQSYFCRLFKRETRLTLSEYINRAHLEIAQELLSATSMRITEIATAAGFGSIQQFNEMFKRYVGLSPTAYRESHILTQRRLSSLAPEK